ncbi:MAG: hypothetical protein ACLTRS_15295 [Lachnospiraceae bacterium]
MLGFKNYIDVFTRDDCFNSLKLAGYYIVASFIQLAMALVFCNNSVLQGKRKLFI